MPNSPATSKDHVEHVRKVHFGLVALSFGLLVAWSTRTRADLERADVQRTTPTMSRPTPGSP